MAYEPESKESRALRTIDSSRYPDTNKDLVKNMRRLNQNVDYIAGYMRIMQKGIDDANKNFIEQIQSFINDLIVLFAGGEPTGIDLGDLKYIIQGLGALFGFGNGPFPLNLLEAAEHFFFGYVVPLPQFTDLIFNSIFAWMEEFGFSEEAIQSLRDFANTITDLAVDIQDILTTLLGVFDVIGILNEEGGLSLDAFAPLWDLIATFFDALDVAALRPIVDIISTWTVPFVQALTRVIEVIDNILEALFGDLVYEDMFGEDVNVITLVQKLIQNLSLNGILGPDSPLNALNLFNIGNLFGKFSIANLSAEQQELLDNPDFREAISIQGGGIWVYDEDEGRTVPGSARVSASGVLRQLVSNSIAVDEGDTLTPSVYSKWSGLSYTGSSPIKLQIIRLLHDPVTGTFANMGTDDVASVASPATNQTTWVALSGSYTVPAGCSHIALQLVVNNNAVLGTIWFDDASAKKTGAGPFAGIMQLFNIANVSDLFGLDVDDIWSTVITTIMNPLSLLEDSFIRDFVKGLLDQLTSILRLIPFVGDTIADSLENLAEGMDALNQTNIGNSALISQIQAALGGGNPAADDFERASLGSRWRVITSNGGSVTTNGHDLVMSHDDTTEYILIDTDEVADSNFQTGEIVLGSAPEFNTVLLDSARGHNDILLRCSNFTTWGTRTMLRCRWSAKNKNIKLSAFVNGSEVVTLFNAAVATASAGSRLMVEAGVQGNERRYIIRVNGAIVPGGDVVEVGTASAVGASNRHRGLGGRTEKLGIDPFAVSPDPGKVKAWAVTG